MHSVRGPLGGLTSDRPQLFIIVSLVTVSVLAIPTILPHIIHTHMIYHILLHISSLIIGIFLSTVSVFAYLRNQSARLLFMTFGFLSLVGVEIFYLLSSAEGIRDIIIPVTEIELTHIILLAMLALFAIGVFKMNNRF
jgi:hypothetical protein